MKEKILIVDDDPAIVSMLEKVITEGGYECDKAYDGQAAIDMLAGGRFSMIILDINMPKKDGFQVIVEVRQRGIKIPIIVISGRKEDSDALHGYDIGADDYITKPFNTIILIGKIKALLRRSKPAEQTESDILACGPFVLDNSTLRFTKNGEEIILTSKELGIMRLFMLNPNKIFAKSMIYDNVWGNSVVDDNTIMVYMNRLRQKIEDDNSKYISNIRGIGYRFNVK